jgi:rubredoxin
VMYDDFMCLDCGWIGDEPEKAPDSEDQMECPMCGDPVREYNEQLYDEQYTQRIRILVREEQNEDARLWG